MDIGSILLIFSILILVALFVFRPFWVNKSTGAGMDLRLEEEIRDLDHQYSALLAEKERFLRAINELDIDQSMGKIPEEDYPVQRANFLAGGARVLRDLDAIEEQIKKNASVSLIENQLEDSQPDEVVLIPSNAADPIEEMVAARRRLRDEKSAGFCPHCGKVIQKSDFYCPRCGIKVVA